MNIRRRNPDCPLSCTFRNGPKCVCNLIAVAGEKSPISLGQRIGLGHFYGSRDMPPCVRGPLGAAYWSVDADAANAVQPEVHAAFAVAEE